MNRSPCAVCDRLTLVREQRLLSADQLPNKHLLLAHSKLSQHQRVKNTFTDCPGDQTKQVDGTQVARGEGCRVGCATFGQIRLHTCCYLRRLWISTTFEGCGEGCGSHNLRRLQKRGPQPSKVVGPPTCRCIQDPPPCRFIQVVWRVGMFFW